MWWKEHWSIYFNEIKMCWQQILIWNNGILEYWNDGWLVIDIMEEWNIGVME
jgi:hypothetical protein